MMKDPSNVKCHNACDLGVGLDPMSNKLMSVLSATNHWHKQFQNYYLNRKKKVALLRLSECKQKQDHNRYQQVVFDSLPLPYCLHKE